MEFAQFAQYLRNLSTLAICFVLASGGILSQNHVFQVSGTIKDDDSGRKLPGALVVVYQDGIELQRAELDKSASYSFELPLGFIYVLEYQRENFTTKKTQLDFSDIHDGDSNNDSTLTLHDLDMKLFKNIDGFDTSILDTPIGIGAYNADTKKFLFNMDHTERMMQRIENELNRLDEIEENRSKNKRAYDVAMKSGENAMKKKKWQEALGYFNEALELIPDDEEATVERDKAREKLDAIDSANADKDAEKADEAAANKAEEDSKAEEKARQEEEARQRSAETANDPSAEARQAQELADRAAQLAEEAAFAANEAAVRAEEAAAAAKRAAVLASGANGTSDDADNFFKDALKAENIARAQDIEAKKEVQEEMLQESSDKADVKIQDEIAKIEVVVKNAEEMKDAGILLSKKNQQDVYSKHEEVETFTAEHNANATGVRIFNSEDIERKKQDNSDWDHSLDKTPESEYEGKAEEHLEEIKEEKASIDSRTIRQEGALDQRRIDSNSEGYDERKDEFDKYAGEEESDAGTPRLSIEDEELPQGYYEYSYEIPNGTVKEITFRTDDEVIRYKKVLMKTGTFYFRDNMSITASIFHRETTVVHD
jgi:hypothetical protein